MKNLHIITVSFDTNDEGSNNIIFNKSNIRIDATFNPLGQNKWLATFHLYNDFMYLYNIKIKLLNDGVFCENIKKIFKTKLEI